MEDLCDFVIENINLCKDIKVVGEELSDKEFADIDRCITIITEHLQIDKKDIEVIEDNILNQKEIIITFKFNGRTCEFYEITGVNRDYLGVRLMPVS
jgi:hypothetical protein